ncbi:hypothetical protein PHMEG_00040750 [Phytophthora megakarya]|uniref:MULE transposase domain-containing protein n=1 Tax=Phytophthora megakarya TaxID=4795 RepID=A0A225UCY7_9STRA|nr:hypothetical protein PHMEG_00040750 [Phytophthora megakarya]
MFGAALDKNGFPRIGKGEDHDPFVLGVTIVGLLGKLKRFQQLGMFTLFHIDATFKLSEIGYPVITCGFSDRARKYHLAAIFVVSRLTHVEYSAVLSALMQVYYKLFAEYPRVDAVLGDAEDAQFNALQSIIAMHYSASLLEFYEIRNTIVNQWKRVTELNTFAEYFEKQWIQSRYWRWQAFHTPAGYATTNNPCETFNASVKRHVMRKMFDTTRLLRKLPMICEDVTADNVKPTASISDPPTALVKTALKLVQSRLLVSYETIDPHVVKIVQMRSFNTESKRLAEASGQAFARLITSKTTGSRTKVLAEASVARLPKCTTTP